MDETLQELRTLPRRLLVPGGVISNSTTSSLARSESAIRSNAVGSRLRTPMLYSMIAPARR